jgi:hypothetical protein
MEAVRGSLFQVENERITLSEGWGFCPSGLPGGPNLWIAGLE